MREPQSDGPEHASQSTAWLTPLRFAGLLALLIVALHPQVLFGTHTFVFRDFAYFGYPVAHHLRESLWQGELPLWNPLSQSGHPFLAQWNTQTLYPPALFYVLFPLSWSLGVFCLLHQFWGGLGMYYLARRWTENNWAAGFAGVAYAFNGLVLNSLIWPNNIAALGWAPWVIWLLERAAARPESSGPTFSLSRFPAFLLASIAAALQMLTGAPEIILLTWLVATPLAVCGAPGGFCPKAQVIGRMVLVALVVTALCAIQLLPFLDLVAHSQRDRGLVSDSASMPWTGWVNFLLPLFRHHLSFHRVYLQHDQHWTTSYYPGAIVLALGINALLRSRNRLSWAGWGLILFGLLMALGPKAWVYTAVTQVVPVFGMLRFPIKFVTLATLLLPLLAAVALASRLREPANSRRSAIELAGIALVLILLGAVAINWGIRHPVSNDDWPATLANAWHRLVFGLLILGALCFPLSLPRFPTFPLSQITVLTLLWFDLSHHAPSPPLVERNVFTTAIERPVALPRFGEGRAMVSAPAEAALRRSYLTNVASDLYSRRLALFSNGNLLEGIPKVDGFYSLDLLEEFHTRSLIYARTNSFAPPLVEFLGVSRFTSPTNLFGWSTTTNFMPLITGGQKPVYIQPGEMLQGLASPLFTPRTEVFIHPEDRPRLAHTNFTQTQILNPRVSAHRLEFETEAAQPSIAVVAQAFYHPWKAYVDDRPQTLLRANYAFQAVPVPAGRHRVRLEYADRMFQAGGMISCAAVAMLGAATWAWRRGQKRRKAQP